MISAKQNSTYKIIENSFTTKKIFEVICPYATFSAWAANHNKDKIVPGFRKGHAPIKNFQNQWALALANELYSEITNEHNITNVENFAFDIKTLEENQDIKVHLILNIKPNFPEIKLEDLEVIQYNAEITEDDLKNNITNWQSENSMQGNEKFENIEINDFVEINIQTKTQDNFEDVSSQIIQIGKTQILKQLETSLIGKNKNEEIISFLPLDEKSANKLKNNQLEVKITILKIFEHKKSDIDYMINIFNCENENNLQEIFKKNLIKHAKDYKDYLSAEQIKAQLLNFVFEPPADLIKNEYLTFRHKMIQSFNVEANQNIEEVIKEKTGLTLEEFDKRCIFISEKFARLDYIASYYAKKFNIILNDDEIEQALIQQSKFFNYNFKETSQFFKENKEAYKNLENSLIFNKTFLHLTTLAKNKEVSVSLQELYKIKIDALNYEINQKPETKENIKDNKIEKAKTAKGRMKESIDLSENEEDLTKNKTNDATLSKEKKPKKTTASSSKEK